MIQPKPTAPARKVKPPIIRYHYKLVTVSDSRLARVMEKALWEQLTRFGLSFFTIGRESGSYDVMCDSGSAAMADTDLVDARAIAAQISKAG